MASDDVRALMERIRRGVREKLDKKLGKERRNVTTLTFLLLGEIYALEYLTELLFSSLVELNERFGREARKA